MYSASDCEDNEDFDQYDTESDQEDIAMDEEEENTSRASGFMVLNQAELQEEMNDVTSEVAQLLEVSDGAIRILMDRFKWDKESLLERFYECSDIDEFLRKARVAVDPSNMGNGVDGREEECGICCSVSLLTGLECRHYACKQCWETYLTTKVLGDNCSTLECMYPGCKLLLQYEQVLSLIGQNPTVRAAFTRLSIDGFVQSNRLLRWCPAADCGRAVKVRDGDTKSVSCDCNCGFCFECAHEWHEPVDCRLLKSWQKKCKDDSETSNWLNANTKDCPKCHVTIEKDGGCNHMTCKQSSCKYEFCWMCLGIWKTHEGNYSCNKFDDTQAKEARDAQELSRAALTRYLHYYNRFMNHQQSRKLEQKLNTKVKVQMEVLQKRGMSWVEVQFLTKAVEVLAECRQTLMYTYAFAFYLKKTNETEIFEANQQDLELATEKLSGFLERDLEIGEIGNLKQEVQDKYRYVDQRRKALLVHCAEGVERDEWRFSQ